VIKYSTGFRDFTHATSDPTMWRDVFYCRGAVLEMLGRFPRRMQQAIHSGVGMPCSTCSAAPDIREFDYRNGPG
jgi:hypothetical protein